MTDDHLRPVDEPVPNLHDAPSFPPGFDPDAVPRFPVIVLEVTPATGADAYVSPYRVTMDGEPVPVSRLPDHAASPSGTGEWGRQAEPGLESVSELDSPASNGDAAMTVHEHALAVALDAASRKIASRGWVAGRVNAVDADGNRWPMIVGANGERLDLSSLPVPPRKHRRWIPIAAAALAVALSGATIGTVLATRAPVEVPTPTPTTTPISRPTAQPTEYPQLPPVGASTHARWAFGPLADTNALVQAPAGDVIVRTTDHLTLLDPTTGTAAWATEVPDNTTGPWLAGIDGQQAVVTGTTVNTTVTWRPLADLNHAHVVPVDATAVITPLPGGLLFNEADQRVGLLAGDGTLTTRLLPAGSTPVGVDGTTVLATNGRQLWRLDRDQPQTPNALPLQPPGAGARPGTSATWRGGRLLTFWTLKGTTSSGAARTIAALHDGSGKLVKVIPVQAQAAALDQIKTPDQRYTLLSDGTVVDHIRAALVPAAASWQGTTLIGSALFGRSGEYPARYDLVTRKVTSSPAPTAADPVGQLGPDLLAVADRGDGVALYRLQSVG